MAEEATRLCEQILTQLQIFFASLQQLQHIQKRFFPPLLWNWWKSHNTEKLKQTAIYFRIWGHTHHFDRIWDHQVAMLTVRVVPPNSGSLSISQQCDRVNWWSEKVTSLSPNRMLDVDIKEARTWIGDEDVRFFGASIKAILLSETQLSGIEGGAQIEPRVVFTGLPPAHKCQLS